MRVMQRPRKSPLAKILALTLTFAMLLGIAITATAAPAYPDISGHWGETAIEKWSSYDVLHGNDLGTFEPDGELDVTQLAQILVNTFGYTESYTGSLSGYTSTWGEEAVRKAVAAGAIEASEAALPLTRELAAKIVAKAFGISPVSGASKFSDDYAISSDYKPYAAALGKAGIFNGNDYGELMPADTFSRAAIMQALDNAVTDIVKENKAAESAKSVILNKGGVTLTEGVIEGDLIIAQGVGDGDITLDGVTVNGRLVIFGGGANSIHVKGKSSIPNVTIAKTFGQAARFVVESVDTAIGTVTVIAESKATVATTNGAEIAKIEVAPATEVSATGEVAAAEVTAATTVTISAKAAAVEIAAENAALTISSGAAITSLTVETKATVSVASGATVTAATIEASDVKLSGAGKVTAVTVTEDAKTGVEVKTSGTKVTVDSGAGTVTTSTGTVEAGKSSTTSGSSSSSSGGGSDIYTPPAPSFTLSVGLSPAQAGWSMDPTAPHWLYYPTVDDDVGTDVGIDAIAVDGGWINGVDGYTQNEITIGGGAVHYFVKVVYSNYTWNAASTLKLTLAPKGDGTGSIDVEPLTADLDRFFLDEANNTVYYFGGATIATGLSANGTAPWLQNARFAAGTMDITASIVEGSTTKISQKTGKVEWKTFEAPTLTDNLTIPADTVAVIPAGTTFTVPSNKTLTIKGTLIVNGTLIGDVQGNGTTAAEWGKISYPATGIGSNSNPMVIDTDDKFTFGGSASAPTVAWTGGHLHIAAGKVVTIPAGAKWTFTTGYNAGVLGTLNVVGDLIVAGTLTVSDDGILTGTVQGNGQQQSDWGKISYPAVGIGTTNPMAMDTYDIITFGVASGVKTVTWVGGHLHIPSGNTTTIPEGAAWVFTTNYYLDVLGTLIVNGAFDVSSGTVINTGALIVGATGTLNIGTAARTDVFNEFASITATEEGGAGAGVKYTSTGSNYSGATFTITTGATVIRGESAPTLGTLYTGYTFGADGKLAYSGT